MSDFLNPHEPIDRHGTKLPHWQQGEATQFVTFRLGDAMPQEKLRAWREERERWLRQHPEPWSIEEEGAYHRLFTRRIEEWLDEGAGSCLLQDPANRTALVETLMRDHLTNAEFHAWVVMPNHVHLIFKPRQPLDRLVKTWKGVSARRIGRGSIWQQGYRDTLIRDETHFENAVRYIRANPTGLNSSRYTHWEDEKASRID